jgi:hypothetical protein
VKVRLAIVVGVLVGIGSGLGGAQALGNHGTDETGDWGCAVIRPINQGICFENPLPPELPSAALPALPAVPAQV